MNCAPAFQVPVFSLSSRGGMRGGTFSFRTASGAMCLLPPSDLAPTSRFRSSCSGLNVRA